MLANRQRGLVNVYALLIALFAVAAFLGYAELAKVSPDIALSQRVNLLPYGLAVVVGLAAAMGHLRARGYALHMLGAFGGMALAFRQVMCVAACIFALMFATKDREISRLFLSSYLLLLFGALSILHARAPSWLAQVLFGETTQLPTVFVGKDADFASLHDWISNRGHLGVRPVGLLADEPPAATEKAIAPYLGTIDRLSELVRTHGVRQVVLMEWMPDTERMERIVEICESEGCRFLVHNNLDARFARPLIPIREGGRHFLALQEEPLEDPLNRLLKRTLDIAISLPVVVFILPPLCGVVWLFQRNVPGPMFFVKPRGGHNRKEFNMLKFRSMYSGDHDVNRQATSTDNRVYPFGRFLRKTSLDEFPQFINVLRGEMSVVGPRPHLPQHDLEFSLVSKAYRIRSLVKPGITGLAQVNGYRGEINDPEKLHRRVYWDLYYVTHWSLAMDVQVILRTVAHVLVPPKEAY